MLRLSFPLAVLMAALAAPAVPAQTQEDADLKAIGAYTLTMPKYKSYLDGTLKMANVAVKNPAMMKGLDNLGNKSMAEQIKVLDGTPQLREAITATGLTPREFVLIMGAALQTGMAHALIKTGSLTPESAVKKAGVSGTNLEWYQQNSAEIERLTKEYQSKVPQGLDDPQ
jgi:hypothetical protein